MWLTLAFVSARPTEYCIGGIRPGRCSDLSDPPDSLMRNHSSSLSTSDKTHNAPLPELLCVLHIYHDGLFLSSVSSGRAAEVTTQIFWLIRLYLFIFMELMCRRVHFSFSCDHVLHYVQLLFSPGQNKKAEQYRKYRKKRGQTRQNVVN